MSTPTILFTDNDYEDSFDWVYHEKKIISSRYIDLIDNYIADHEELIHPAGIGGGDNMVEEVIRRADVMWMLNQDDSIPSELIPLYKEISRGVHSINQRYWGYTIGGLEALQYTRYRAEESGHYDWHQDTCASCPPWGNVRKITFVIGLSNVEDYSGGLLEVNLNGRISKTSSPHKPYQAKLGVGDVCIFPSFLSHRVEPVERGVRKTLVGWARGPSFK